MYAYRSRSWLSVMVRLLHFVRQTMWYVRLMWLIFFVLWGCCIGYAVQRDDVNVEVKPSRLLLIVSHYPGAMPPVTYIGKPMCTAFQAGLSLSLSPGRS